MGGHQRPLPDLGLGGDRVVVLGAGPARDRDRGGRGGVGVALAGALADRAHAVGRAGRVVVGDEVGAAELPRQRPSRARAARRHVDARREPVEPREIDAGAVADDVVLARVGAEAGGERGGRARRVGGGVDAVEAAAVAAEVQLAADQHGRGGVGVLAVQPVDDDQAAGAVLRGVPAVEGLRRPLRGELHGREVDVDPRADHHRGAGDVRRRLVERLRIAGAEAARGPVDAGDLRGAAVVEEREDLRADEDRHVPVAAGALRRWPAAAAGSRRTPRRAARRSRPWRAACERRPSRARPSSRARCGPTTA